MAWQWAPRLTALSGFVVCLACIACSDSEPAREIGGAGGSVDSGPGGSSAVGGSGNTGGSVGGASGGSAGNGGGASGNAGSSSGGSSGTTGGQSGNAGTGADGTPLPPELTWTREGPREIIEEIWGSSAGDVYAVGRSGVLLHSAGDGTWEYLDARTGANLNGIWGSGPNDVYVSVDSNVILHWTGGGEWLHEVQDPGYYFKEIWGSGPDDVYALGPGVLHRSATGWERPPQSVATGGVPLAIWGSSATDIYITCGGACTRKIFHSTGDGTWQGQETPEVTAVDDVWGVDANQVYAGANAYILFSSGDGTWTIQLTTPNVVRAGWAANKDAVYACAGDGLFYRSNGRGLWSEGQDIDPDSTSGCHAIWGTGPDNIYVGAGAIYHGTPAQ